MSVQHPYVGRPWRSRFLRAPKVALRLAERGDFIELGALAGVRLGMKTGADKFFYLTPVDLPRDVMLGSPRVRRDVGVVGMSGWRGRIGAADLRPALRNPHELWRDDERLLVAPRQTARVYLFPRDRQPTGGLAEYVALGEHERVHERQLVQGNAEAGRWYRQVRGLVTSSWALPYNSAYDYGAFQNDAGAVLNGRFVGVEPREDIDSDLLGAVLNSTMVIATRLLEGTATGTEGAYDVGPPAARLVRVPDPRKFADAQIDAVRAALNAMRADNHMPGGPDRDARVHPLRRDLDLAVAAALGLSAGDAQYLVGELYENYARWRRAVEDVEARMRTFRGQMARAGRGRAVRPADLLAGQLWDEAAAETTLYPSDALAASDEMQSLRVAAGWRPPEHEPLYNAGRIVGSNGEELDLGSFARVRYLAMLMELGFSAPFSVPITPIRAETVVEAYLHDRLLLLDRLRQRVTEHVAGPEAAAVVDAVMRRWARACRERGMQPPSRAAA